MPCVHTPRASHSQEQMHSKNFEVYLFVLEAYFIFNKMDIYHLPRHCVSHVSSGIVVCFPMDHMLVRQLHRQAQAHYPAMVQEIGYSKESGCLNSSWNVTESLSPIPLNCCVHFVILLPTKPSGSFHKTTEVFNTFEKLLWVLMSKSSEFSLGLQKLMTSEQWSWGLHMPCQTSVLWSILVVRARNYKQVDTDLELTPIFGLFFSFKIHFLLSI